ncbi:solute carrier family 12 cation cotransporter [Holotrichia oblita]|uniref:Solute carrier family 12 cation cotransporter n=1 Tax=Holotrichia oblita TaxID=644536 RepID=A0ACB9SSD5_HOLOL|nr:solute carrier family 12 cation cotransporter [Holotrichia oblita]
MFMAPIHYLIRCDRDGRGGGVAFYVKKRHCSQNETWYGTHDTVNKEWIDNSHECLLAAPPSRGKGIIILHAGSDSGCVDRVLLSAKNIKNCNLDYHEDMTAQLFEEWFQKNLVLPERRVIVMDNVFVSLTTVGVVYRPPRYDYKTFLDTFQDTLATVVTLSHDLVCLGDLNINLLHYNDICCKDFSNMLNSPPSPWITDAVRVMQTLKHDAYLDYKKHKTKKGIVNNDIDSLVKAVEAHRLLINRAKSSVVFGGGSGRENILSNIDVNVKDIAIPMYRV